MKSASKKEKQDNVNVDYQPASLDIWDKKYRLKDISGLSIDLSIGDTFKRVAKALAGVEHPSVQDKWEKNFFGPLVPVQSLLGELCPMQVQGSINQLHQQSTAPSLVLYRIQ